MSAALTTIDLHTKPPQTSEPELFSAAFQKARVAVKAPTVTVPSRDVFASDDDLILMAARNDTDAFLTLYDRHAEMVCGVAMRILRNRDAAEDATATTFFCMWQRVEELIAAGTPVAGWLALTVRQIAIALLEGHPSRNDAAVNPRIHDGGMLMQDVESLMEGARKAIRDMPAIRRKALEMAFFDGLLPDEIATVNGETADAVRAGIRASLLVLRRNVLA